MHSRPKLLAQVSQDISIPWESLPLEIYARNFLPLWKGPSVSCFFPSEYIIAFLNFRSQLPLTIRIYSVRNSRPYGHVTQSMNPVSLLEADYETYVYSIFSLNISHTISHHLIAQKSRDVLLNALIYIYIAIYFSEAEHFVASTSAVSFSFKPVGRFPICGRGENPYSLRCLSNIRKNLFREQLTTSCIEFRGASDWEYYWIIFCLLGTVSLHQPTQRNCLQALFPIHGSSYRE